jgi:hypothetical protein
MTGHIYRHGMVTMLTHKATAQEVAHAEAYYAQNRRIAEIRRQLVADGMSWQEANDEAIERAIVARDHQSADAAADAAQTGETR